MSAYAASGRRPIQRARAVRRAYCPYSQVLDNRSQSPSSSWTRHRQQHQSRQRRLPDRRLLPQHLALRPWDRRAHRWRTRRCQRRRLRHPRRAPPRRLPHLPRWSCHSLRHCARPWSWRPRRRRCLALGCPRFRNPRSASPCIDSYWTGRYQSCSRPHPRNRHPRRNTQRLPRGGRCGSWPRRHRACKDRRRCSHRATGNTPRSP